MMCCGGSTKISTTGNCAQGLIRVIYTGQPTTALVVRKTYYGPHNTGDQFCIYLSDFDEQLFEKVT